MTSAIPFERKTTPQLDTAVRSLSTLRKPVRQIDDGDEPRTVLADIQLAVRRAGNLALVASLRPGPAWSFSPASC
jgi:hypothetical protein